MTIMYVRPVRDVSRSGIRARVIAAHKKERREEEEKEGEKARPRYPEGGKIKMGAHNRGYREILQREEEERRYADGR